jgi:hypothetical protein
VVLKKCENCLSWNIKLNIYYYIYYMKFIKLYEEFENVDFSNSVIVDSGGNLLELYHGTNNKFKSFDESYQKNGWLGKGFYFTDDKKFAKENGKYVMKVLLNIKNPFYVKGDGGSDAYSEVNRLFNPDKILSDDIELLLKANSYDGVIFNHWDNGLMYSCFYPHQIKIV